jgi:F-type H+-transporting ATPase subunit b
MKLITPDFGLLFWTALVFILLMFLLTKFAFKPILGMVNAREQKITEALELAEKTKSEMKLLAAQNEQLLQEARVERDAMIKDAKEVATKMVEDSKTKAKEEAEKVMANSMQAFESEKSAAIAELKTQMASFSLEIAEKVIRGELANDDKQKALAEALASDINLN